MLNNASDISFWKSVVTTLTAAWVILLGWLHVRVNNKVSKEVFQEFKDANENYHKATHKSLKEIKETQQRIYDKLDKKQDKG